MNTAIHGDFNKSDPFVRFIASWIAFNSIYESLFPNNKEYIQIDNISNYQELLDAHSQLLSIAFYENAIDYIAIAGVYDNRSGRQKTVDQARSLNRVIEAIYQIRCNLFHGSKDRSNDRDRELCIAGFVVITNLISFAATGDYVACDDFK